MTRGAWAAAFALLVLTMGTSIITPLFPLYQDRFALSNGEITLLFAVYSLTVAPTMLLMGNLSDVIGRKRVILPALTAMAAGSAVMGVADSVPVLFAGRVLQGLAIGGMLGVGTAFVVDHARPQHKARAAALAGLAFRVGFGLGPGLGGLVAANLPDPVHLPFRMHAALTIVAILVVIVTPETVRRARGVMRIGVGVPAGQFRAFVSFLAPAIFLMSFLDGTLLSVVPLYMTDTLGVESVALIGLVGFFILGMGGVSPFIFGGLDPRRAVMIGAGTAAGSSLLIVLAAGVGSVFIVVAAAALIGLLNGLILQGATTICGISVPLRERGKLISALYMTAYSGTVPTIGIGYLSQAIGLTAALAWAAIAALGLAAIVLGVGRRLFPAVVPYAGADEERPRATPEREN